MRIFLSSAYSKRLKLNHLDKDDANNKFIEKKGPC